METAPRPPLALPVLAVAGGAVGVVALAITLTSDHTANRGPLPFLGSRP